MKKFSILLVVAVIISFFLGFIAKSMINNIQPSEGKNAKSYAGIYITDNWGDSSGALRLYEDGTCKTWNGNSGTWEYKDNKIIISYVYTFSGFNEEISENRTMELDIVNDGLVYSNMFFEKK